MKNHGQGKLAYTIAVVALLSAAATGSGEAQMRVRWCLSGDSIPWSMQNCAYESLAKCQEAALVLGVRCLPETRYRTLYPREGQYVDPPEGQ